MKINWGGGIVIAIALFMGFILYFVIKVQVNPKYDNDLVVEEYYKHDAVFGEEMERVQNAEDLAQKPIMVKTAAGIIIVFPTAFTPDKIKGMVSLDTMYLSSTMQRQFLLVFALVMRKQVAGSRSVL